MEEVETLNEKLKDHKLVCYFCGLKMAADSINNPCDQNNGS